MQLWEETLGEEYRFYFIIIVFYMRKILFQEFIKVTFICEEGGYYLNKIVKVLLIREIGDCLQIELVMTESYLDTVRKR